VTISVRNSLLTALAGVSGIILLLFFWFAYRVTQMSVDLEAMNLLNESRALLWTLNPRPGSTPWRLGALGALGALSLAGQIVILRLFRRTSSTTMLFLALFLVSLILDLGKVGYFYFLSQGMTPMRLVILSRTIRFGHFFGLFALLASSLYHAGVDYPKTGSVALVMGVVTASLVYMLPIDSLSLEPHLVHSAGDQNSLQVVETVLGLIVVANGVFGALQRPESRLWLVSLAFGSLVLGRELVFFLPSPALTFLGIGLLSAGAVLAIYRTRKLVLWQ
jgi:hypothetical protein